MGEKKRSILLINETVAQNTLSRNRDRVCWSLISSSSVFFTGEISPKRELKK
jgi:hypothetical protein